MSQGSNVDPVFEVILFPALDCRDSTSEVLIVPDPCEEFLAACADVHSRDLSKASAKLDPSIAVPTLSEIIGIEMPATAADTQLQKRSSSRGKIRLERTEIDGESWVVGYDFEGNETSCRIADADHRQEPGQQPIEKAAVDPEFEHLVSTDIEPKY